MRHRRRFVGFIVVIQFVLWLTHYFVYQTFTYRLPATDANEKVWLQVILGVLSVSFVAASTLAFSYTGASIRAFYRASAVWMGLLSFLFLAGVLAWLTLAIGTLAGVVLSFHRLVEVLFAIALAAGFYGVFNASWTRITRARVRLANLPEAWRGRKAALVSDVHLGHVRNGSFLRRLIRLILSEEPDAIFIAGDLYDGTAIDAAKAAEPLSQLTAPHGVFFVAGNHEQFGDDSKYLDAVEAAGVRVLRNEKVN